MRKARSNKGGDSKGKGDKDAGGKGCKGKLKSTAKPMPKLLPVIMKGTVLKANAKKRPEPNPIEIMCSLDGCEFPAMDEEQADSSHPFCCATCMHVHIRGEEWCRTNGYKFRHGFKCAGLDGCSAINWKGKIVFS